MEDKVWYSYPEDETKFQFRVSLSYDECKELLAPIIKLCKRFVIYQHDADSSVSRTHVHGLLRVCERKHDTIRNAFKKAFPKQYQLAETYKNSQGKVVPVDDGYITYMANGTTPLKAEPKAVESYTPEELRHWADLWEDYESKKKTTMTAVGGKIVITKEVEQARRLKRHETIMKVVKELQAMKTNPLADTNHEHFFPYPDVSKMVVRELTLQQQCVGMYKVCEYVDAVMMYFNPQMFCHKVSDYFDNRDSKFRQRFS